MPSKWIIRPRRTSTFRPIDPDALSWQADVIANGGTVSYERLLIVDQFTYSEKISGAWASTDDYWLLWGENAIQARTSLKQRRLAVAFFSPVFVANRGYTFNGTANYLATGFIPNAHAVAMSANNARIAVYERANVAGTGVSAGAQSSTGRQLFVQGRGNVASQATLRANVSSTTFALPSDTSLGFTSTARDDATASAVVAYRDGAALTRLVDPVNYGATLPLVDIYIGALNNAGTAASFRPTDIGLVAVGAKLFAEQEMAQRNAVHAMATTLGANV